MTSVRFAASLAALLVLGSAAHAEDCDALKAKFKDATERYEAAYKRQNASTMCTAEFIAAGDEVELVARERVQIREAQNACPPVEGETLLDLNAVYKKLSTGWKRLEEMCGPAKPAESPAAK